MRKDYMENLDLVETKELVDALSRRFTTMVLTAEFHPTTETTSYFSIVNGKFESVFLLLEFAKHKAIVEMYGEAESAPPWEI